MVYLGKCLSVVWLQHFCDSVSPRSSANKTKCFARRDQTSASLSALMSTVNGVILPRPCPCIAFCGCEQMTTSVSASVCCLCLLQFLELYACFWQVHGVNLNFHRRHLCFSVNEHPLACNYRGLLYPDPVSCFNPTFQHPSSQQISKPPR